MYFNLLIVMKVKLIQADIRWGDPGANRAAFERKITGLGAADLIVLPEMFTTGFCTSPRGVAEPAGGPTLEWMRRMARERDAAIAGSVAVEEGGRFYNRFYFVRPDGTFEQYDKHHLFTYGGEHHEYTGGDRRVVAEFRGWRILLMVCYDVRFPVWARNRGDYDLILYVASWPAPRAAAWDALLRARAIENVCYVAGVNRVGDDPACQYAGGTVLYDFVGSPLAEARPGVEETIGGRIDRAALDAFRTKFPALGDADPFTLNER